MRSNPRISAGKDCGTTAWMLNSLIIIHNVSKHHFMPQEDSLINVINIIVPGMWVCGCVRPGVPEAPADTERRRGSRDAPAGRQPGSLPCLRAWGAAIAPESLQQLSLAGLTPSASPRNPLLVEGDDGVFILQRFQNPTVAIRSAVASPGLRQTCQCPHTRKNQAVTRFCCTALFFLFVLFS